MKEAIAASPGATGRRPSTGVSLQRGAAILAIALAFAVNAAVTWQQWGDLVIDTGRELDTPKQLAEGRMLYRDVRYWYGPLAPYLHAGLYRLCGVRLEVLTTTGLVLAAALGWLSYRVLRLFVGRLAATVGAASLLTINGFGCYFIPNIFNFVLPYSFPAVYGMLLALASVYFLLRHLREGRFRDFLIAAGLLGLVALCKLETLAAALGAHATFLVMIVRRPRIRWHVYALGYAAAAVVPAAVLGYFRLRVGPELWRDNLFVAGNVNISDFVLLSSGFKDPLASLRAVAGSFAALAACLVIGAAAGFLPRRGASEPGGGSAPEALRQVAPVVLAVIAVIVIAFRALQWETMLNGLPLLILVSAGAGLAVWWRRPEPRHDQALVLFGFAIAAVLRIALRCSANHYGFYLSVPALLALVVIACGQVPRCVAAAGRPASRGPVAAGLTLVLVLAVQHVRWRQAWTERMYPSPERQTLRAARGTMVVRSLYVGSADDAVRYLQEWPGGTTVAVFPEGAAMPFLAGLDNAVGMHTYLPIDFSGSYDEPGTIRRLAASPPDLVVITSRDVREYGKRRFGVDYAQPLILWMSERYELLKSFESTNFVVHVTGREGTASPPGAPGTSAGTKDNAMPADRP